MGNAKTSAAEPGLRQPFLLGNLTIDPVAGVVQGPAGREQLDPKVMDVLCLLAQRAETIVSREELLSEIWPKVMVTDDALSRCIYHLRRHLVLAGSGEDAKALLETLPKRGYRLNCKPTVPAAGAIPAARASSARNRRPVLPWRAAVVVVLLGIALATAAFWPSERADRRAVLARSSNDQEAENLLATGAAAFRGSTDRRPSIERAIRQYQRALEENEDSALAWARLAMAHTAMYFLGFDRTPERAALAKAALERAFALDQDLPEAHLALGNYLSRVELDYSRALDEFAIAEQGTHDSDLYLHRASTYRHLGRWEESIADLARAIELDSTNVVYLRQQHTNYLWQRDYAEADQFLERILRYADEAGAHVDKLGLALFSRGDPSLAKLNDQTPPLENYAVASRHDYYHWLAAIFDLDYPGALTILQGSSQTVDFDGDPLGSLRPMALYFARTYRLLGDEARARAQFESARQQIDERLSEAGAEGHPDETALLRSMLAETQAGLGQAAEALAAAEDVIDTLQDPMRRSEAQLDLISGVWLPLGDRDRAVAEIRDYLGKPGRWSLEALRKNPRLASLWEDPRLAALSEN